MNLKKITCFLLFIFIGVFFINLIKVEAGCSWKSYQVHTYYCTGGCGEDAKIMKDVWVHYNCICCCGSDEECPTCSTCAADDEDCTIAQPYRVSGYPQVVGTAEDWQSCAGGTYTIRVNEPLSCSIIKDWITHDISAEIKRETNYSGTKPYFKCDGNCLESPSQIRYYNNPYYPQKPELTKDLTKEEEEQGKMLDLEICEEEDLKEYPLEKNCIEPSKSKDNITLPLKIDWNENAYWLENESNCGPFGCFEYAGGPQSYIFTLDILKNEDGSTKWVSNSDVNDNLNEYLAKNISQDKKDITQGFFKKILNLNFQPKYIENGVYVSCVYQSSEYNLRVDHNPCWLKSGNQNEGYNINIQTCCNEDGTNCNLGIKDNFKTSFAPELKFPEDLDWEGPDYKTYDSWASLREELKIEEEKKDSKEEEMKECKGKIEEKCESKETIEEKQECENTELQKCKDLYDYGEVGYDKYLNLEGYFNLPYDSEYYKPFDYNNISIESVESSPLEFPIFLDWCGIEGVNKTEEKGSWLIKTFQFLKVDGEFVVLSEDEDSEEIVIEIEGEKYVEYPNLKSATFYLNPKAVHGGVDFRDVLYSTYYDEKSVSFFGKNTIHSWEVAAREAAAVSYKAFGQHWSFETGDTDIQNKFILLSNNQILGIPALIEWGKTGQINSFIYEGPGGEKKLNSSYVNIEELEPNTTYTFSVTPCTDFFAKECEVENKKTGKFKTTGAPPESLNIEGEKENGSYFIPVSINWSSVTAAKAYVYSLNGSEKKINNTSAILSSLKTNSSYSLKVKSCADSEGLICGEYSEPLTFKTFQIKSPENIIAGDNGTLYTNKRDISWDEIEGVNYYYYSSKYNGGNDSKTCKDFAEEEKKETMLANPRTILSGSCEGSYTIQIKGCMSVSGEDCGSEKTLTVLLERNVDESGEYSGGLVPCGNEYDNPDTAWDETQSCKIEHIFLLIKNILDFILWRAVPALLIVMLLYTAGVYIFHKFVDVDTMTLLEKTKSIWKSFGIGFAIIFGCWTLINFILLFLNANMSFFNF